MTDKRLSQEDALLMLEAVQKLPEEVQETLKKLTATMLMSAALGKPLIVISEAGDGLNAEVLNMDVDEYYATLKDLYEASINISSDDEGNVEFIHSAPGSVQ